MAKYSTPPLLNSIPPELVQSLDPAYVDFHNKYFVGRLATHQVAIEKIRKDPKRYALPYAREYGGDVYHVSEQKIPVEGAEITVRIFEPRAWKEGDPRRPAYVNYHGGGWSWGGLNMDDSFCRRITRETGCVCFDVDYRLAPENPFPIPVNDAWTSYKWVINEKVNEFNLDVGRIAVGGMSAGGHLAAIIAHKARDEGVPLAFQFLSVASFDLAGCFTIDSELKEDCPYNSIRELYWTPSLPVERMMYAHGHFVGKSDPETYETDWMISPLRAPNFANLAPALVITAEMDGMKDEAKEYVKKMTDAGVKADLVEFKAVPHLFMFYDEVLDAGKEYNKLALRAFKDALKIVQ